MIAARVFAGVAVAGAMLVGGCASSGTGAEGTGSLLGGFAARESASSAPAARSIVAALGGGLIGPQLGASVDERDRRHALEAEYRALEYSQAGQQVPWTSADGTISGQVVAYQPYRVGSQDCRQYAHSVTAAGQTRNARGTACRNADGSWTPLL